MLAGNWGILATGWMPETMYDQVIFSLKLISKYGNRIPYGSMEGQQS